MKARPETDHTFGTADYAVFFLGLLVFSVVGIWTGLKGVIRQTNAASGRHVKKGPETTIIPVSFSLLASLFGAPFCLGSPANVYLYGSDYMFLIFGSIIGISFSAYFIIGKVCRLGVASVYEYYELRFGMSTRVAGVILYMINTLLILASSMYGPGLVISIVIGIPIETSAIAIGLVGTIYITLGGLRGVVWVDVAQMLLLLLMLLAVFAIGIVKSGGAILVFDVAVQSGRISTPNVNPNPTNRITVWTQIVGGAFSMASFYSTQTIAQKIISVNDIGLAQRGSVIGAALFNFYLIIASLIGIVIYVYNIFCDPYLTNVALNPDQLLPYFVMQMFQTTPGASGLFVASMIGASLSNIGAGINALAALTMINFVNPLYVKKKGDDIFLTRPFIAAILFKITAAIWAVCVVIGGYIASVINRELMQLLMSFVGIIHGPLFGVFVLGIFFPFANKWGALTGMLSSFGLLLWIFMGSIVTGMVEREQYPLPLVTTCPNYTMTIGHVRWEDLNSTGHLKNGVPPLKEIPMTGLDTMYSISFMYYGIISVSTTIAVGIIVSLITCDSVVGSLQICLCQANISAAIWIKENNDDPKLGYLWWFKPSEESVQANILHESEIKVTKRTSVPNAMQTIQQQEVSTVVRNLSKISLNSETMKEKYKLSAKRRVSQNSLGRLEEESQEDEGCRRGSVQGGEGCRRGGGEGGCRRGSRSTLPDDDRRGSRAGMWTLGEESLSEIRESHSFQSFDDVDDDVFSIDMEIPVPHGIYYKL